MGQGFSSLLEYFVKDFQLNKVLQLTTPQPYLLPSPQPQFEDWASSYPSESWSTLTSNVDNGIFGFENIIDPFAAFDSSVSTSKQTVSQDESATASVSAFAENFSNLPLDFSSFVDPSGFEYDSLEKPSLASLDLLLNTSSSTLTSSTTTTTATTTETSPVPALSISSSPITLSPADLLLPTTPTSSISDLHSESLTRQQSQQSHQSYTSLDSLPPLDPTTPHIRINFSRPESLMGPALKHSSSPPSSTSPEPTSHLMSRTSSSAHSTKSNSSSTSSKPRFKDIPDPLAPNTSPTIVKRVRNTLAARRYRAKKVEKMEQLEEQLAEMEAEKERWRNEAMNARLEAEKWKGMWLGANGGMGSIGGM